MKKYSNYKDSEIEWVGLIPEHWEKRKFKWDAFYQEGPGLRTFQFKEAGIRVICVSNITDTGIDFKTTHTRFISEDEYQEKYTHFTVEDEDILLSSSGSIGKVSRYFSDGQPVILNTSTIRIHSIDDLTFNDSLVPFLLRSEYIQIQLKFLMTGGIVNNFGPSHLGQLIHFLPPPEEQTQIARYLDYKTAKIDALIAKKQRLIELLEEERTAIINQAVTKGLDENVPMKDSGIEWLGEIPEHWEVLSFRFCIEILTDYTANGSFASLAENVNYLDEGYSRLVRLTDLRVDFSNDGIYVDKLAHNFLKKSELFGGELLIANVGAYAGLVKLMPEVFGKYTLGPNMFLLRLNQNTKFFYYQLNSPFCAEQLKMMSISSAQPKLNKDNIRQLKVVQPPKEEQEQLLKHIEKETSRLDSLTKKVSREIELLSEYKTALISEVVTGKVDVRDEVIPE